MVRFRAPASDRLVHAVRIAMFLGIAPVTSSAVEIVAHRGASYEAPENTLPAVLLAWERDADAVEIDIHQTRDGRIVAIHDRATDRVAGRAALIAETSLRQLQTLDVGTWKGVRWKGTRIPTLAAVLGTVPPGKTLVVEIKCPSTVLPELERVLDASGKRDHVTLIAFEYKTIVDAKRRFPSRPAYWLYHFSSSEADSYGVRDAEDLIDRVESAGLDGLDVRHDGPWVETLARTLLKVGKSLYVYTVNDAERARWLRKIGVAGITTDRPGYLREALSTE